MVQNSKSEREFSAAPLHTKKNHRKNNLRSGTIVPSPLVRDHNWINLDPLYRVLAVDAHGNQFLGFLLSFPNMTGRSAPPQPVTRHIRSSSQRQTNQSTKHPNHCEVLEMSALPMVLSRSQVIFLRTATGTQLPLSAYPLRYAYSSFITQMTQMERAKEPFRFCYPSDPFARPANLNLPNT